MVTFFYQWFEQEFVPAVENILLKTTYQERQFYSRQRRFSPSQWRITGWWHKALFLPENVMSLCQPLDQRILEALKKNISAHSLCASVHILIWVCIYVYISSACHYLIIVLFCRFVPLVRAVSSPLSSFHTSGHEQRYITKVLFLVLYFYLFVS